MSRKTQKKSTCKHRKSKSRITHKHKKNYKSSRNKRGGSFFKRLSDKFKKWRAKRKDSVSIKKQGTHEIPERSRNHISQPNIWKRISNWRKPKLYNEVMNAAKFIIDESVKNQFIKEFRNEFYTSLLDKIKDYFVRVQLDEKDPFRGGNLEIDLTPMFEWFLNKPEDIKFAKLSGDKLYEKFTLYSYEKNLSKDDDSDNTPQEYVSQPPKTQEYVSQQPPKPKEYVSQPPKPREYVSQQKKHKIQLGLDKNKARVTREVSEECLKGYKLKDILGQGSYGSVSQLCLKDDCKYAIKMSDADENAFYEVDIIKKFSALGVGPKFIGSWECENVLFIVTEKWDGTLHDDICLKENLIKKICQQIDAIHKIGYVHGDIVEKNVLVKIKNDEIIDVTLTDFGVAAPLEQWTSSDIITFYNYHQSTLGDYYKDNSIILEDVIKDPTHLDMALVWKMWKKCNGQGKTCSNQHEQINEHNEEQKNEVYNFIEEIRESQKKEKNKIMIEFGDINDYLNTKISEYQKIGEGADGKVYVSTLNNKFQVHNGVKVAVKKIEFTHDTSYIKTEIRSLVQAMNGECGKWVNQLYGVIGDKKYIYLILELIEGKDMAELISNIDDFFFKEDEFMTKIAIPLIKGLKCLHKNNISHGDIKPDNIMITRFFAPYYIDFGVSCLDECENSGGGTRQYLPYEYWPHGPMSKKLPLSDRKKNDIWALGCTLYATLTRNDPEIINYLISRMKKYGNKIDTINILDEMLKKTEYKDINKIKTEYEDVYRLLSACFKLDPNEREKYWEIETTRLLKKYESWSETFNNFKRGMYGWIRWPSFLQSEQPEYLKPREMSGPEIYEKMYEALGGNKKKYSKKKKNNRRKYRRSKSGNKKKYRKKKNHERECKYCNRSKKNSRRRIKTKKINGNKSRTKKKGGSLFKRMSDSFQRWKTNQRESRKLPKIETEHFLLPITPPKKRESWWKRITNRKKQYQQPQKKENFLYTQDQILKAKDGNNLRLYNKVLKAAKFHIDPKIEHDFVNTLGLEAYEKLYSRFVDYLVKVQLGQRDPFRRGALEFILTPYFKLVLDNPDSFYLLPEKIIERHMRTIMKIADEQNQSDVEIYNEGDWDESKQLLDESVVPSLSDDGESESFLL